MIDPLLSSADAHNLLCCSFLGLKILMWPHWQWFKSDWNLWHSAHIYPAGKRAVPCSVLVQKPEGFPYGRVSLEPWEKRQIERPKKSKVLVVRRKQIFCLSPSGHKNFAFFFGLFLSFSITNPLNYQRKCPQFMAKHRGTGLPKFFCKNLAYCAEPISRSALQKGGSYTSIWSPQVENILSPTYQWT